jgi:hypothetical protein
MNSRVLYFPLINVPQNAWFARVLLYWDEVGAIVPNEVMRRQGVTPYMKELIHEGLVSPTDPAQYERLVYDAGTSGSRCPR